MDTPPEEMSSSFTPSGLRRGFALEAVGIIMVWQLRDLLPLAQQNCVLGESACSGWRLGLMALAIALMVVSLIAIMVFLKLPARSIPPEKVVGTSFGVIGVVAGLLVAISIVIGRSF